jgi:hypothetical protein
MASENWVNKALHDVDWSAVAGVYAAMLSTFLALFTYWSRRVRLFANLDTRITTTGDFSVKIISSYYKPIFVKYYRFFTEKNEIDVCLYENCNIKLSPHAVTSIWLGEMHLHDFQKHEKLFIELYFYGRKKIRITIAQ